MTFKPYKFDPLKELEVSIPKENKREALEAAAEFLKTAMLEYIGEGKSPVSGGRWVKSLSKDYLKEKSEESSVTFANLEFSGHLLDNLNIDVSGSKLVIDVHPDDYGKAEGHITGKYGENSKEKPRQFMPQDGQTFKKNIMSDLKKVLKEFEE